MPLILLCSIWSYWRTVNVEMANATLQFLDEVERERGGLVREPETAATDIIGGAGRVP